MAYRSQSKRLSRPSLFALLCAALWSPFIAGCQSNAQQDLVAREMRMQEDQIYALEDYLAEYQQLICKVRAENAALRQQLANGGEIDEALPQRPSRRRTEGPAIEAPATPRTNGPPPEIELPDVPPLEETTSSDADLEFQPVSDGEAASAAGQFADVSKFATPAAASEPTIPRDVIREVWLHGEVVENDTGGGPRLIVEIEPLDTNNQPARFAGSLSLMLLTPGDDGEESLARWDFSPEEVQAALEDAAGDDKLRFHLELTADIPITESTQLLVRLLPQNGDKLLAHADIDLHEPGFFSSFRQAPPQLEQFEERPIVAAAATNSPSIEPPAPTELNDAGWSIARPGEPANSENGASASEAQWRASDEPPPIAVARSTPAKPQRRIRQPAPRPKTPRTAATPPRRPAGWSPDRPRVSPAANPRMATSSGAPRWSATR